VTASALCESRHASNFVIKEVRVSGTSRREVVKLALGLGLLTGVGCGDGSQGSPSTIGAGTVAAYPVGSLKGLANWAVYVGRDGAGLYAMSSICTHQGCDMGGSTNGTGPYCGCHGSQFDANGNVVYGPARSSLVHFPVTVDHATGAVTVDGTQVVSQATRVPV
jgi:Rieske Fe-S protein